MIEILALTKGLAVRAGHSQPTGLLCNWQLRQLALMLPPDGCWGVQQQCPENPVNIRVCCYFCLTHTWLSWVLCYSLVSPLLVGRTHLGAHCVFRSRSRVFQKEFGFLSAGHGVVEQIT